MFPQTDPGFLAWSLQFKTLLVATPTAFGVSTLQATNYGTLHDAFATSMAAVEPGVRTKSAVVTKNACKKAAMTNARFLAGIIYGTSTVSNAQRTALGLPLKQAPMPVPVPGSSPAVEVVSVSGWNVKVKIHDSTSTRRGKPKTAQGAALFSYVGTTPPTEISDWKFESNVSRSPAEVIFDSALPAGTKVFLTAFWFNNRKQSGPACSPVSTNLQGGGVVTLAA